MIELAKCLAVLFGLALLGAVYFLPAINAQTRQHRKSGSIFTLNLLLGWSVLGWVLALVWSFTKEAPARIAAATPDRMSQLLVASRDALSLIESQGPEQKVLSDRLRKAISDAEQSS